MFIIFCSETLYIFSLSVGLWTFLRYETQRKEHE